MTGGLLSSLTAGLVGASLLPFAVSAAMIGYMLDPERDVYEQIRPSRSAGIRLGKKNVAGRGR